MERVAAITLPRYYVPVKHASSRLTAQGQISVPAEIRRRLSLGAGSVLEWELRGDDVIVRRAARASSVEVHQALFGAPPRKRTLAELKEGVRRYVRGRHARG